MLRIPRVLLAVASLAIWATAAALATSPASAQDRISTAETLLFQTDHLKNVAPPATLSYAFTKAGSAESGFDDTVRLRIRSVDGVKRVAVAFLTGGRKIAFPEVTGAEGNPVLLCFLERDIREMQRLTGGKSGYFRKAIRLALARSPNVARTRVSYAGRESAATEVTIAPYVDDPLRERIGKYASKTYVFTLSAAVPGGVYSVRSFVPSPKGSSEAPLLEERLTLLRR